MTEQTHAPLPPARRMHILASLARDGVVRVSQLTEELGVTPVTLRRDLAEMEELGLLVRVHGGAVTPREDSAATPSDTVDGVTPPAVATGEIAVLVPSMGFYWPGVVHGMEAEARRRGYRLRVRAASYELTDERPVLERLLAAADVRGVIAAPNPDTPYAQDVIDWLGERTIPSVLVEREALSMPGRVPVESATSDHALGAVLAARHLAELGHQRVGLILSRDSPTGRKIARGWEAACTELALTPSQHFEEVFPPRSSPEFSVAVDAVLDTILANGVTGLLVHSDPEAMALIDLALARGLSVPDDLSVIAYDDEVASMFTPPLTAVRPPREEVGAAAVDLLVRRLEGRDRAVHRVSLSPMLNVRQSTAQPAG
ncbi:DeoR family transcriptional regulator [Microbacterium protaetiae]|uniref:DeoR family transcriptional regulator n=1 Tax=Microbacterium protaetiae TaxID=2509458 RepID=A0A4P6EEP8_9MICO|nr:substrate-binding domain-containing protein [Microbacterium protaetiae]QAY60246.1 DeoR family transcriptional regulator [Microbacterium protaetiae]